MTNGRPSRKGMHNAKSNDKSGRNIKSDSFHTILSTNSLNKEKKREVYSRLIPTELWELFNLQKDLRDENGNDLLILNCPEDSNLAEMRLFHKHGFQDPVLYGQITDTINGQIHVLLYILNDPSSMRFNVDRMPDGSSTRFGILQRNIEAELEAMRYGLAPGQTRRGLRLLGAAIDAFEDFVSSLGHDIYFVEPLYYHNAIIFESYGFRYSKGRRLMERIQTGFAPEEDLYKKLDGSTPFREPQAAKSIRLRSWAIHDNIMGEPFTEATMYKQIGNPGQLNTCKECTW